MWRYVRVRGPQAKGGPERQVWVRGTLEECLSEMLDDLGHRSTLAYEGITDLGIEINIGGS